MTPRPTLLNPAKNSRYPTVDAPDPLGTLHLKMPLYSTCSELMDAYQADKPDEGYAAGHEADIAYGRALFEAEEAYAAACAEAKEGVVAERPAEPVKPADDFPREPMSAQMARMERVAGACIGLCWYHRGFALETVRLPGESLASFGPRVCEELYDAGLSYRDVAAIGQRILLLVSNHLSAGLTVKAAGVGVGKP